MNPIITDALTTAGEMTRTVAANLRSTNYTIYPDGIAPDDELAVWRLADALIADKTGHWHIEDRYLTTPYFNRLDSAAMKRDTARRELKSALLDLSRDERIRLIDALADGLSTVAA